MNHDLYLMFVIVVGAGSVGGQATGWYNVGNQVAASPGTYQPRNGHPINQGGNGNGPTTASVNPSHSHSQPQPLSSHHKTKFRK